MKSDIFCLFFIRRQRILPLGIRAVRSRQVQQFERKRDSNLPGKPSKTRPRQAAIYECQVPDADRFETYFQEETAATRWYELPKSWNLGLFGGRREISR